MFKKLLAVAILSLLQASSGKGADDSLSLEMQGIGHLAEYLGLKTADLSFRPDYTKPDSFRLQVVADLMNQPLGMIDYAASLRSGHKRGQPEIIASILFQDMARWNQAERGRAYRAEINEIRGKYTLYYLDIDLNRLLTQAATYLTSILPQSSEAAFARLSKEQRLFLRRQFMELLVTHKKEEFFSVETMDSVENAELKYAEQFAEFGMKIDKDPVVAAGIDCLRQMLLEAKNVKRQLSSGGRTVTELMENSGYLPSNADLEHVLGRQSGWAVGGSGNDYYEGDYWFILDLGGDDLYDLSYDPANPHGVIIIDLSGNDVYRAKTDFALAAGCFSSSILIDLEGDDRYDAKSFGLGAGYFGFGVLYDADGDDRYDGDTFVEGAGCFGLGLLIDESGQDMYYAALSAQGFGFVEGIGAVIDGGGNDTYFAGGKYKDILRYEDHYYSFSQGFAIGVRPILSGGIGAVIDFGGNDNYLSDIFAQGSSYWWSLGMIYDIAGNDSYQSFQYAQGAATHMSVGIVIDETGTDVYYSKGVSQGCGHDYSCGILLDRGGNDTYIAFDLSQAAGSANGVGLLIDNKGNDRYFIKNPANTQGYGNPRREFGSIGMFLDLGGTDQYWGNGKDNYYWRTSSKWGGGMDIEFILPDTGKTQ